MAPGMQGFPPVIPGLTSGEGTSPGAMDPMQMVAMMMGQNPPQNGSSTEKMSQVIQLLREIAKEDPRIGLLANDALRLLVEGPQSGPQAMPAPPSGAGPMPGGSIPMGGPGGQPGMM